MDDTAAAPATSDALPEVNIPEDLNPAGMAAAFEGFKVTIGGVQVLARDVVAYVRCRPGRPIDGCQGRGFAIVRARIGEKAVLTLCACAVDAWTRANSGAFPPMSVLTPTRARQEADGADRARSRADRKRGALVEAKGELAAILAKQSEAIGTLAQDLANADAREAVYRGRAGEAAEWVRNCDQRIAELEKLRAKALADGHAAFDEEVAAHAEAAALRVQIEAAKEAHGPEERAARRKVDKLERRVATFVSYHPEAASAP